MKPMKKETAAQRRRRMTYETGDLEPLGRSDKTPESALNGTLEQWDDALFKNADKFNVCVVTGHGRHSRVVHSFPSFTKALDTAKNFPAKPSDADERVLIYAVNPDGKFACLPPDRWDHVSVSVQDRCPTWDEMQFIAGLFFKPDEVAMQLHVPAKDHINNHPFVLHWWRPHSRFKKIPLPPKRLV